MKAKYIKLLGVIKMRKLKQEKEKRIEKLVTLQL